jgi:hypothetical protein
MFKKDDNIKLWGFKEIRYENMKINYIKYFKKLFPQTKVLIQIRQNTIQQSKSSWYKKNANAIHELNKANNDFFKFYNQNKDWCFFTTFERMFDTKHVNKMFEFIDCKSDFDEQKIIEILNNNLKD